MHADLSLSQMLQSSQNRHSIRHWQKCILSTRRALSCASRVAFNMCDELTALQALFDATISLTSRNQKLQINPRQHIAGAGGCRCQQCRWVTTFCIAPWPFYKGNPAAARCSRTGQTCASTDAAARYGALLLLLCFCTALTSAGDSMSFELMHERWQRLHLMMCPPVCRSPGTAYPEVTSA